MYNYLISITPDFDFFKKMLANGFNYIFLALISFKMLWNLAYEQGINKK